MPRSQDAFDALLRHIQPGVICDVGSMDATESLRFRHLCPSARVIAFEANPHNYARILLDPQVKAAGIEVVHAAATNMEGEAIFHVLEPTADKAWAKGASSLRKSASGAGVPTREVTVPALRLDGYLSGVAGHIVLWIDVEGAAAEVVEGLAGIADRVAAIHIEVEHGEFWEGQETAGAVLARLRAMGFRAVASVADWSGQDNVILIRPELVRRVPLLVHMARLQRYLRALALRARRVAPSVSLYKR